jgi:hypothetical protein
MIINGTFTSRSSKQFTCRIDRITAVDRQNRPDNMYWLLLYLSPDSSQGRQRPSVEDDTEVLEYSDANIRDADYEELMQALYPFPTC